MPERLQVPVNSIVDEHHALKGAVILGWTHCGNYLVSYTSSPVPAADGAEGHHLQVHHRNELWQDVQVSWCVAVYHRTLPCDYRCTSTSLERLPSRLQLWSFHLYQRAVRQCNVPLFSRYPGELRSL